MKTIVTIRMLSEIPRRSLMPGLRVILLGALALLLAGGCTVGPDYVEPDIKTPAAWNADLQDGLTPEPVDPRTLAQWWETLEDKTLSSLIERAVLGNLDLKNAQTRVREARALRGIRWSGFFPTVDATGFARESRSSENSGTGTVSELYAVGFDAAWELDVFGGVRRSVEAADAELAASRENLHDVLVSLLAEVALNYVEARTFQARLQVAQDNTDAQEKTYELVRSRFEAGLSDELGVQQALYNLQNTRSQIPMLHTGLAAAKNRLAVLLGAAPGSLHQELDEPRPIPVPPLTVAIGVPADTLRHRPDVRRSERLLAAQTARIGVATADLYPRFFLNGTIGLESTTAGNLLKWGSRTWGFGPGVSWNVFDAGAVRKNIEVQSALQEQALIQYESAILAALEEVENAVVAYAEEQFRRESLSSAAEAANRAVLLAQDQYRAGLVDFNNVLDAQRSLLSFQDALTLSEGTVTSNLVRLYKALGGGWRSLESPTSYP